MNPDERIPSFIFKQISILLSPYCAIPYILVPTLNSIFVHIFLLLRLTFFLFLVN